MTDLNLHEVIVPKPGEHPSNEWAELQANPSSFYPAVIPWYDKPAGSKRPIKHSPEMLAWERTLQVDDAAYRELLWVAGGAFNRQGNEPYIIPGHKSYIPPFGPWPQPPVSQPVTSVKNLVNVLEVRDLGAKGKWARIETVPTTGPWTITPASHPWLFNAPFTSIRTGDNETGNAIDSRGIVVPYFADGEAWVDMRWLKKYEQPAPTPPKENRMLNLFPPINKGAFIWKVSQCFGGNIQQTLDFAQSIGIQTLVFKISNGLVPWVGLEPWMRAARDRGFTPLGFSYFFGYAGEGEVAGKQAAALAGSGMQGLLLDVEKEFDLSAGAWDAANRLVVQKRLVPKAEAIGEGIRKFVPTLPVALNSWRTPNDRPTPMAAFLKYCDANSPQVYSVGTGGPPPSVAADRIDIAIAQYRLPANGGWTGPTFPSLAAYHQDGNYVTVPQLAAVNARVKERGLPGEIWWSLPYLIEKPDWRAEIKSHDWPASYTPAPTVPDPKPLTMEERMDRAEALMKAHGWL